MHSHKLFFIFSFFLLLPLSSFAFEDFPFHGSEPFSKNRINKVHELRKSILPLQKELKSRLSNLGKTKESRKGKAYEGILALEAKILKIEKELVAILSDMNKEYKTLIKRQKKVNTANKKILSNYKKAQRSAARDAKKGKKLMQ